MPRNKPDTPVTQQELHTLGVRQELDTMVAQQERDVLVARQERTAVVARQERTTVVARQERTTAVAQQERNVLVALLRNKQDMACLSRNTTRSHKPMWHCQHGASMSCNHVLLYMNVEALKGFGLIASKCSVV